MATRQCNDCKGTYEIEYFSIANKKRSKTTCRPECKSCHSARSHGITGIIPPKPKFAACAVCLDFCTRDELRADHKHEKYWTTKKPSKSRPQGLMMWKGPFRAWLCHECNTRVGWIETADPYLLRRTLAYCE